MNPPAIALPATVKPAPMLEKKAAGEAQAIFYGGPSAGRVFWLGQPAAALGPVWSAPLGVGGGAAGARGESRGSARPAARGWRDFRGIKGGAPRGFDDFTLC